MELVIPSSVKFYTPLVPHLAPRNPVLAQQVINALNAVDRQRRTLFLQAIGDIKVTHQCLT